MFGVGQDSKKWWQVATELREVIMPTIRALIAELLQELHTFGVKELSRNFRIEVQDGTDNDTILRVKVIDVGRGDLYAFQYTGRWERVD
jgi:hypothetical protein